MKKNIISAIILATLCCACADNYESDSAYQKPTDVAMDEYLASFQTLKSYVDTQAGPSFSLSMNIASADLLAKGTKLSLGKSNFTALQVTDDLEHATLVGTDGTVMTSNAQTIIEKAKATEMKLHGSAVVASYGQNYAYLNGLIAADTIKGGTSGANILMYDFESQKLGTEFLMSSVSTAVVEEDPDGESGHVLHVGAGTTKAKYSYPIFNITLPEGITLGDCATLIMDMKVGNSTGRFGSGMRMAINDGKEVKYGTPNNMGCPNNQWGRGAITMDFSAIPLTDAEKALTQFTIKVGSATGSGDYLIDNIYIRWERHTEDQIIEKTAEEKKQILTTAMTDYIKGLMKANAGIVTDWDVVAEPTSEMDGNLLKSADEDVNTSTSFYWQDYLGEDYIKIACDTLSKYFAENGGDASQLKLYIDESNLFEPGSDKTARLKDVISASENDGKEHIAGISAQLSATYSLDAGAQANYEQAIEETLQQLAATGKLIRLTNLSVNVVKANGVEISSSDITDQIIYGVSDYYKFIISKYFEIIPTSQRAGINWKNPVGNTSLWDTDFNRLIPYIGCCEGLSLGK